MSEEQKTKLQQQAQQFEEQLQASPSNVDAVEGAGVTYAQLGQFDKAEQLLTKLTTAKPQDAEAWRLLVSSACNSIICVFVADLVCVLISECRLEATFTGSPSSSLLLYVGEHR